MRVDFPQIYHNVTVIPVMIITIRTASAIIYGYKTASSRSRPEMYR